MWNKRCENKYSVIWWSTDYSPEGEISVSLHSDGALNVRKSARELIRTIQNRHFITTLTFETENTAMFLN